MTFYDCFTFHNEFQLLELRLRELGGVVDRFVLVEANQTLRGAPKPYYFEENKERFSAWADQIIHVKVAFPETLPRAYGKHGGIGVWEHEHYQRDQIARGLADAAPDDPILVSDVDEIPQAKVLSRVLEERRYRNRLLVFALSLHRFKLNRVIPDTTWLLGPRMVERKYMTTPQQLRRAKAKLRDRSYVPKPLADAFLRLRNYRSVGIGLPVEIVPDAGWHFSSMGSFENFILKRRSIVVEGVTVERQEEIEAEYRRQLSELELYPLDRLPACVASGDFDALIEPSGK